MSFQKGDPTMSYMLWLLLLPRRRRVFRIRHMFIADDNDMSRSEGVFFLQDVNNRAIERRKERYG